MEKSENNLPNWWRLGGSAADGGGGSVREW